MILPKELNDKVHQIKSALAALPAEVAAEINEHLPWAHQHPFLVGGVCLLVGFLIGAVV